ncbi:DUF2460 domain-containing protein [Alsobacter sp. SYSU M60028]|uniref:DUF2460 domain-containing protein n=1 Tax=Alsobacter ponti TaxID=2962936 RepID=A0ABT1L8P1_9HYPH|nr:DUF2460 domain-containing protein [Alsobacter ponti]MCP8937779.1 DUF2460 domain-containing protein [Alsobacter ponti]
MASPFDEVRFPLDVALRGSGGPRRRTDVVATGSGREERNARWAHARRVYDAGSGVKTLEALAAIVAFFEERRGRLTGFRWRDRLDDRSCAPGREPTALDQAIGVGDGARSRFQLVKTYGEGPSAYTRPIVKPVPGSVRVAVDGVVRTDAQVSVDPTTGVVAFAPGFTPPAGARVTAGYLFDVPVRFDTDELSVDLDAFAAGEIPRIPLIEIVP